MVIQNPNDLFIRDLTEMRDVAAGILQMLPQQRNECSSDQQIQKALSEVEAGTEEQVQQLDRCLQQTGAQQSKTESPVIRGVRQQHEAFLKDRPTPEATALFDLEEIAKVENYALAGYTGLVRQAQQLGQPQIVESIQQSRDRAQTIERQVDRLSEQVYQRWTTQPARTARAG